MDCNKAWLTWDDIYFFSCLNPVHKKSSIIPMAIPIINFGFIFFCEFDAKVRKKRLNGRKNGE